MRRNSNSLNNKNAHNHHDIFSAVYKKFRCSWVQQSTTTQNEYNNDTKEKTQPTYTRDKKQWKNESDKQTSNQINLNKFCFKIFLLIN